MNGEIHIRFTQVEKKLRQLQNTTEALTISYLSSIAGENELDVVRKLDELNGELRHLLEKYKTLLLSNIQSTFRSLDAMKETDQAISSSIIGKSQRGEE
ncbi:YwqI/YxiC family protein [Parageobacillus thermoglucosidasius]|uniref:YwqI/YxiC family protein n=1 Tax=Parageobacillus thermoglucosidasius TaxID=1426 RepID=UPI0027E99928|nr:YwqI/YxiC family protein [Parageobacillus thermoglucosidasius]MED4912782.1 YwqI/YxiC family protein [Parageobacillus thermoglucosidasius]MED4945172.1 YwqI/YxiC family protein [Parageobacillus thermoglucosidasius]MED4982281.1 YwqI/YxiC family protein [Parageobacillus thermoglucosidasius]GMN98884.1 YwqI/YxiC family protein [Parageobacillus thermoglucosidasius]